MEAVLDYFRGMGDFVDRRWEAHDRRPDELPAIAVEALETFEAPDSLTPERVLRLMATGTQLPRQLHSTDRFGEPPVIAYLQDDFEIQVLNWMEGSTSVHQHGFDGAFKVQAGSSLHVEHDFDQRDELAEGHVVIGSLVSRSSEILRPGAIRPIVAGPSFIHALFHLERPSVTIVIRNKTSGLPFPQYDYRLPGVGFDVLFKDDPFAMRVRALRSLARLDRGEAIRSAREIVQEQDLWTGFRICDEWASSYDTGAELDSLIEDVAHRDGALAKVMPAMYVEKIRVGRILTRRGMMRNPRHRLFLALIVNLPDAQAIRQILTSIDPGRDPDEVILEVIQEMASPEHRGISGLALDTGDLAAIERRLKSGDTDQALGTVAKEWNPSPLLSTLFAGE